MSEEIWTYSEAGKVVLDGDFVNNQPNYAVDDKVMLTQTVGGESVTKYFLIAEVELVGGDTYLTLDSKGLYTLTNDPITFHRVSNWSMPTSGFPLSDPAYAIKEHDHVAADITAPAPTGKYLKDDGTWDTPAGSGTGDVVGPAGATDGNIPLFDGATGKLIKNSTYAPSSFAAATHNQAASTINSGTLDAARIPDLSGTYVPKSLFSEQGDIAYRDGSGWQVLHHGATIRQFLKTGAHGANPSWSSLGLPFVTVGASDCDYTTDGTDDAVQIQEAIDYCAGAADRPKTVMLLSENYELGNYGLTLKRGIELRGMKPPRAPPGAGTWVEGQGTTLNITSTTYSAVTMRSCSVLRNIRFDYPNQSATSVTVYPPTITDDVADGAGVGINGIVVENIVGCMPYNFIEFADAITGPAYRVDYQISHIRGDPLYYGITLDKCVHLMTVTDAQFVPGFGGRMYPSHGDLINCVMDHLRAFYSNQNDGGYFQDCIVWCSHIAFEIGQSGQVLNNCMGDASYHPLIIASGFTTTVLGGYYGALAMHWTGSAYETLFPEDTIAALISGDYTCIHGARFISSECCISIAKGAKNTVISGNAIHNVGSSGETVDWIALIWDGGTNSSITGNTIDPGTDLSATATMGILVDGIDCVYSGNTFVRGRLSSTLGDYSIYEDEVRCIVEGISRNDGDPNTTGNWFGKRYPGVIVHDFTNDKRYIDVSTYGQTPTWKEI